MTTDENIKTCPKCSRVLPTQARFCSGCGCDLQDILCSNCGEKMPFDATFCSNCGLSLTVESANNETSQNFSNKGALDKNISQEFLDKKVQTENHQNKNDLPVTSWGKTVTGNKSTFLAFILSFFISGSGIIYAGRVGLGIAIMILTLVTVFFLIGIIFWIYGMYKACSMCSENNRLWTEYLNTR